MSEALYNRYRPRRFDDVVGQGAAVRVLKNSLATGRLAHAVLFQGPRGTGKTSVARILAAAVNCASPSAGEPCGECPGCKAVRDGSSLLLVEIDAASHRGVDDVREIQEGMRFVPEGGARRVYVVDEVHMLSNHAFNSLLKTLEDPPDHVLFVLATTDPQKVPETVRSRCQALAFTAHGPADLAGLVERVAAGEGWTLEAGVADLLARLARGSARDALVDLEKLALFAGERLGVADAEALFGVADRDALTAWLTEVGSGDPGRAAAAADAAAGGDLAPLGFLDQAMAALQEAIAARAGSPAADPDWLARLGDAWDDAMAVRAQRAAVGLRRDLRWEDEGPALWRLVALLVSDAAAYPSPQPSRPAATPRPKKARKAATAQKRKSPPPASDQEPAPPPPEAPAEAEKRPAAAVEEPGGAGAPGVDDPDWGRLLAALKEEDLPLWVVLQSRPFLGWREGAALVSDRPGSLSWRQLTSERVATVLSKVGSDALDRPVALRPVEDKGREEIAGRLRDHGLLGEWL